MELVEFEEEKVAGEAMVDGVLEFVEKTLNPARTGAVEPAILTAAPAARLTCERSKCGTGAAGAADGDEADEADVFVEAGAKK